MVGAEYLLGPVVEFLEQLDRLERSAGSPVLVGYVAQLVEGEGVVGTQRRDRLVQRLEQGDGLRRLPGGEVGRRQLAEPVLGEPVVRAELRTRPVVQLLEHLNRLRALLGGQAGPSERK